MYYLVVLVLEVGVNERKVLFRMLISLLYHFILFFTFLAKSHSKWDLSSLDQESELWAPALKTRSLRLYIAREVPSLALLSIRAISPFAKIK